MDPQHLMERFKCAALHHSLYIIHRPVEFAREDGMGKNSVCSFSLSLCDADFWQNSPVGFWVDSWIVRRIFAPPYRAELPVSLSQAQVDRWGDRTST